MEKSWNVMEFGFENCVGTLFGPRRDPRWVPALVKRFGTRSVNVRVVPRGPAWRRHIDQLQRRYVSPDDTELGDTPRLSESREENPSVSEQLSSDTSTATTGQPPTSQNASPEYGPSHPWRSKRPRKPSILFFVRVTISLPHRVGVRVVFSRTFLAHVWRKCRGADCFCRQMILFHAAR